METELQKANRLFNEAKEYIKANHKKGCDADMYLLHGKNGFRLSKQESDSMDLYWGFTKKSNSYITMTCDLMCKY